MQMLSRLTWALAAAIIFVACSDDARAQVLTADYQFQNTRASSVAGAPDLVDLGSNTFETDTVDGASRQVLRFAMNNGVSLSPTTSVLSGDRYTIVMLFKFSQVSGFRRLIDFKDRASDSGAYIESGHLKHGDRTDNIQPNTYVQIVYTRDGSLTSQRGYVDGRLVMRGTSPFDQGIAGETLNFFRDDLEFPGEASAGSVARIRIYDGVLTDAEVAELDLVPGGGGGLTACSSGAVPIPDRATSTSTIQVSENLVVGEMVVRLFVSHPRVADLDVVLRSPQGTELVLVAAGAETGADLGSTCDPQPDYVVADTPSTPLSYFNGENARGTWTLRVTDSVKDEAGTIECWCLELDGTAYGDALVVEHVSGFETFSPIVVRATLSSGGAPVEGAGVVFEVDGAGSPITSESIPTDANGQATFVYTRFRPGMETVTAESAGKRARLIAPGDPAIFALAALFFWCEPIAARTSSFVGRNGTSDPALPRGTGPAGNFATYLGGSGDDKVVAVAVDAAGDLYLTGYTGSANFPTAGAFDGQYGGGSIDAFVVKLSADGSRVIYATYIGGNNVDAGTGIAVDAAGNAYVSGYTGSTDFPVSGGLQQGLSGPSDAFLVKLDPTGSALVYATYLGGSGLDAATDVAVDAAGSAYVAGITQSTDFPVAGAIQSTNAGEEDAFVLKVDAAGSTLVYATYLGGPGLDGALSIALGADGSAYVTGGTTSRSFPVQSALRAEHGGGSFDGFVARIGATGSTLVWSTYLGGRGEDAGYRIAVDAAGAAYVVGETGSADFPTAGAAQAGFGGTADAFVAKLDAAGTRLVYGTFLGGHDVDRATGVAVGADGSAYVTGFTLSTDLPVAGGAQPAARGRKEAFVTRLAPAGGTLLTSTFLGGFGDDEGFDVAVDAAGVLTVVGHTTSTDLPTRDALQPALAGARDLFVVRTRPGPSVTNARFVGKKLVVSGANFDDGAAILVAGQAVKTKRDRVAPTTTLVGKKATALVGAGETVRLRVRNRSGEVSNEVVITR